MKIKSFQRDFNENFAEEVKVRRKLCSCFEIVLVEICQWQTRPPNRVIELFEDLPKTFPHVDRLFKIVKSYGNIQGSIWTGIFCVF